MEKLNKLFKIIYDLLSELNNQELVKLRYFAVMEKDLTKIFFYNKKIDLLTKNISFLNDINQKIKEERIIYNNYLVKNNKKDFYR